MSLYALYCSETANDLYKSGLGRIVSGNEMFQFTVERMRRFHGEEHSLTVPLFPDFFFFESKTDINTETNEQLPIISIADEVSEFLLKLFGSDHHISMSRGYIKDAVIYVTEGPLVGYEERIVRIDRHKRLAWLKLSETGTVNLGKKSTDVLIAGLEIVEADEDASIPLKYGHVVSD